MKTLSDTAAREKPAATTDEVVADCAPVVITRAGSPSVVMLSLEDYESMEETACLTSSPADAQRLTESIHALEKGEGIVCRASELLKS